MENNFKMLAKTLYGFEDLLAKELTQLGAQDIKKGSSCRDVRSSLRIRVTFVLGGGGGVLLLVDVELMACLLF